MKFIKTIFLLLIFLIQSSSLKAQGMDIWEWAIQPQYEEANNYSEDLAGVKQAGKWGFINKIGVWTIEPTYEQVNLFKEGLVSVKMDGAWGFINSSGKWQINPRFEDAYNFSEGLAGARQNGKWGFINRSGEWSIDPVFDNVKSFSESIAAVTLNGKPKYIDKRGNIVIDNNFDEILSFSEDLAPASLNGKYQYIDKSGVTVINQDFEYADSFSEELARIFKDNKWCYINSTGRYVHCEEDYSFVGSFSEELAFVEQNGKYGFIDKNGKLVIDVQFEYADSFSNGMARVVREGKWGFIKLQPSLKEYLSTKINRHLSKWMVKGEFEKTATYMTRTSINNQNAEIKKRLNAVVDSLSQLKAADFDDLVVDKNYVADIETYNLKLSGGKVIPVKIPIAEARKFRDASLEVRNPVYTLNSELIFKLTKLNIVDLTNDKLYDWSSTDDFQVSQADLDINYTFNNESRKIIEEDNIDDIIKGNITRAVNISLMKWSKKDEFETTQQYRERTSPAGQDAYIERETTRVVDSLILEKKNTYNEKIISKQYDSDNQSYRLTISNGKEIIVKIPVEEARLFSEAGLESLVLTQPTFVLNNKYRFELTSVLVNDMLNVKSYPWENTTEVPFEYRNLDISFNPVDINGISVVQEFNNGSARKPTNIGQSDVDINIPNLGISNPDAVAVVIGNTDYRGSGIPNVDYAANDAKTIKEYLEKMYGFRSGNIIFETNIGKTQMELILGNENDLGSLSRITKKGRSDVFVFYSGHGAPDPNTKTGYLMPTDANPNSLKISGYSLETLFRNLAKLEARSVQVVIDACFSGGSGSASGEMLVQNASPIGIRVNNPAAILDNGLVISASSESQVASWYPEMGHGLLTYFYLKGIKGEADFNNDNKITVKEIEAYITNQTDGLPYTARRLYGREQTPDIFSKDDERPVIYLKK